MSDRVTVPLEPTVDMVLAALRAVGLQPKIIKQFEESLPRTIGTPDEPAIVCEVRAAIAVGAGLVTRDQIKRGWRP